MGFQHRVICEDKRWLNVEDDYHHHLKAHGLKKFHGNEHEGYQENRGVIISRLPWEHSLGLFRGRGGSQVHSKLRSGPAICHDGRVSGPPLSL